VVTNYSYDTLNRLQQISYNVGTTGVPATPSVNLTYGTSSTQFNNGRVITMTDGVGSENYTYNNLGQMTQLQKVISGATYTINYALNLANELTSITYPSTRAVSMPVEATDPSGLSACDDTSMNLPGEGEEQGAFLLASYRVSEAEPEPVPLPRCNGGGGGGGGRPRPDPCEFSSNPFCSSNGGGNCMLDGGSLPCDLVGLLTPGGSAAVCPNNDCSKSKIRTGPNGQWQVYVPGSPGQLIGVVDGIAVISTSAGYWQNVEFVSMSVPMLLDAGDAGRGLTIYPSGPTIGPNPDWSGSKRAMCTAQATKAAGKDLISYDVFDAVANSIATGSFSPLKNLFSMGTAATVGKGTADYVAGNRGVQVATRGFLRSEGVRVSANAIGKRAGLFSKAFAAATVLLAANTARNAYSACMSD
jgi:hypothetical protein